MEESKIVVIDGEIYMQTRLYTFNDLSEKAQLNALNNYIKVIAEYNTGNYSRYKNLERAFKECERLKMPWFLGKYIFEYCGNEIKKELQNSFLFTGEGYTKVYL